MDINVSNTIKITNEVEFISKFVADELTVENPKFKEAVNAGRSTWGIQPVIKNFNVDQGIIHLPRGYLDRLLQIMQENNLSVNIIDNRSFFGKNAIQHEHVIDPRDYQYKALSIMAQHTEGVLVAPAGSGKTVMGIALAIMAGQKMLWITHTKVLADQFINRVGQFITNLEEDDLGSIMAGKWIIGDKITVGLVQTLVRSPEKINEISDDFGMVIVDEAHHCPASTFTSVVNSLNPYYLYGLTATPKRRDGLQNILFQNIGPVRHVIPRSEVAKGNRVITPTIKVVKLQTPLLGIDNYQQLLKALVENDERNNIIISDIVREQALGNVCIVVTDRKIHAEILFEKLKEKGVKVGIATGHYNNNFRKTTLTDLEKGLINTLVCTSHLVGEGFDHAPLNRLFLCLPFRDEAKCEQVSGRVQRSCPGKTDSIIYDYVDESHGLTKHQFRNNSGKACRYNVYIRLGCNMSF